MRIGIDAKNLAGPLSGISRYVASMVEHLAQRDVDIELFAPAPIENWQFSSPKVTIRHSNSTSRLSKFMWSSFELPQMVRKSAELDVFWGPAHRLNPFLPSNLPKIVTIHDLVWRQFPETMPRLSYLGERLQMPMAIRAADAIVTPSFATVDVIEDAFPAAHGKTNCVYPGTTAKLGAQTAKDARPFILFVGTLEPRKNLMRLIEAFTLLPNDVRASFDLKIVGAKGWRLEDVDQSIKKQNVADQVEVLGFVSDEELEALYAGCEFLVLPSLGEGFGLPIIEAQKYGKPVLTSKTSAMPEVARDGGFYVDPNSTDDVRRGLQILMTDPELRAKLSYHASQNAMRFDWGKAADQFINIALKLQSQGERHAKNIAFL